MYIFHLECYKSYNQNIRHGLFRFYVNFIASFFLFIGADKFHPDIFGREDHIGLIKTVTADLVRDTGATLFEMDDGSQAFFNKVDQTIEPDNHVTLVSFYKVCIFFELLCEFWY